MRINTQKEMMAAIWQAILEVFQRLEYAMSSLLEDGLNGKMMDAPKEVTGPRIMKENINRRKTNARPRYSFGYDRQGCLVVGI